jgi:hypothetical protein
MCWQLNEDNLSWSEFAINSWKVWTVGQSWTDAHLNYAARIYGDRPAISFNEDGSHVAFLRQDNSGVDQVVLPVFEKHAASGPEWLVRTNHEDVDVELEDSVRASGSSNFENERSTDSSSSQHVAEDQTRKTFHFPMVISLSEVHSLLHYVIWKFFMVV